VKQLVLSIYINRWRKILMGKSANLFGGDWTTEKLERVRKYLVAYATLLHTRR